MQWKSGGSSSNMIVRTLLVVALFAINVCDGARRTSQRRKDTHRSQELYAPTPSAESLQAIAEAMGAAGFEHYTEGRPLVKRLIPVEDQADLVEFQGVIGKAGVDFPAYPTIPSTGFNCKNVPTGYYADLETDCQVFHICDTSRKISFLCPNGTIFSQSHLICDWWFKVDCASAPALYESSAEYYSNEQKKTQRITQSLSKAQDFIPDSTIRAESRRATINVPSTTERLLRHRQKLQTDTPLTLGGRVTPRSLQALLDYSPTQRSQITTAFENRKRNLVQLISNNFGNSQTTSAPLNDASTHRPQVEVNGLKEMQVAAETASFAANNNNRQFLQEYNKNYRPYPVYSPNTPKPKPKSNPNLTTLYDIRDKKSTPSLPESTTTKRPTLVPYTKSYTTHEHRDPYTRPGVSLLRNFVQKERNRTLTTTTEKVVAVTQRSDNPDRFRDKRVTIETKDTYESVTKIPHTTLAQKHFSETGPSDKYDGQASTHFISEITTEPSYKQRRARLLKKLNSLDSFEPTEPTEELTTTEKNYGDLPNRPGLVVPPSLTPKTLHSLAIYYATALDNLSTAQPEDSETTTPSFEDYIENMENLPGLFSQQTLNKYSNLFGQATENPELLEELKFDPNGTYNELSDDLSVQQSQNPIATSPQIRELAQVFTHALSAYLQDPVQFRKVLSDIRPTQPSFGDLLTTTEDPLSTEPTTTVNEEDDEILGFSDDHKEPLLSALREPKALSFATDYPTAIDEYTSTAKPVTEYISTTYSSTTPRVPFKCCGRISASYITPSTPFTHSSTPAPVTNTVALNINTLSTNSETVSTESSYVQHRFGGFQNNIVNNDSPYGNGVESTNARPLNEYVEATNLPTAWGIDNAVTASTNAPVSTEEFESKKISTTSAPTTNPVYFTETESVELENEEELQRAHSQSFIAPQGNSLRQGKQLNLEETKTTIKKPSEELEAPTFSDFTTTVQTTSQPSTTVKITETESPTSTTPVPSSIFTSPDSEKTTFIWTSNFDNWHSTVIDPITLNDGLSPTGPEEDSEVPKEPNTYIPSSATTADYTATTEQAVSSTGRIEVFTPTEKTEVRSGRLLKDLTSTEPAQDLSTITDTVVEKAKEIMGGMNATTTEKLMNVMKKTKSKTVRRLILLLVQTCDDDHNTTAEASKRALLEALMAVSQKDMDEIAKEEGLTDTAADVEVTKIEANRRTDRQEVRRLDRRGKSINFDPSAINSLSNPPSNEAVKTTQDSEPVSTTLSPRSTSRRGLKKYFTKPDQTNKTESPIAEARVAPQSELKPASDTRALELLRSLYTIAARWG